MVEIGVVVRERLKLDLALIFTLYGVICICIYYGPPLATAKAASTLAWGPAKINTVIYIIVQFVNIKIYFTTDFTTH